MSGYTKGPWVLGEMVDHGFAKYGHPIYFNEDYEQVVDFVYKTADANLISAAPDLFEALDKMLDHFEGSIPLFLFEMAEAAIAKAKGTEQ